MSRKTKRKESNADAATESGSTGGRGSSKILVAGVALTVLFGARLW